MGWSHRPVLTILVFAAHVFRGASEYALEWNRSAEPSTWAERVGHAAVCLNGTIVTMGGAESHSGPFLSDVYSTTAGGTILTKVSYNHPVLVRWGHAVARVPSPGRSSSFMLIGGAQGNGADDYFHDAWLTIDDGKNFTKVSDSVFTWVPGSGREGGRYFGGLVAFEDTHPNGTTWIAFGGGRHDPKEYYNEIRSSTDNGATWTTLRTDGGGLGENCANQTLWSGRVGFGYAYLADLRRIVLTGGKDSDRKNDDVWASDDGGTCWTMLVNNSVPPSGYQAGALVAARNSAGTEMLLRLGGYTASGKLNTTLLSLDGGTVWSRVESRGGMAPRSDFALVYCGAPYDYIAVLGGSDGTKITNDVWTASVAGLATAAPTAAPTTAPTYPLEQHVDVSTSPAVREDGTDDAIVLSVASDARAVGAERITVVCAVEGATDSSSALVLLDAAPITITSSGVSGARTTFAARGVWDAAQNRTRRATVRCTVTSTVPGKSQAVLVIPVTVRGVAQPSLRLFCVNTTLSGTLSKEALAASCGTALTTNGGDRVLVLGGDCATCPQPPFGARTNVTLDGVALPVDVAPDGSSIVFYTPTVAALSSRPPRSSGATAFEYDEYLPIVITTPAGAYGEIDGVVALGPGAPAAAGDGLLACAPLGLCPPGRPAHTGPMYVMRCLGWPNPISDLSWSTTNDAAVARRFAYGTPESGCRACPVGCRCPGGNRCRTMPGYYLIGEVLPTEPSDSRPVPCHAVPHVAVKRCAAWDASRAATRCELGYRGIKCAACDSGYHGVPGGECRRCPDAEFAVSRLFAILGLFLAIAAAAAALVAAVQRAFGRKIGSGAVRSAKFASWVVGALAMQAQVGRTASSSEHEFVNEYYTLLKIFELNPAAAAPSVCAGTGSASTILALCASIATVVLFVLLGVPIVARSVIPVVDKFRIVVVEPVATQLKEVHFDSSILLFVFSFVYSLFVLIFCLLDRCCARSRRR
jgi:hypothetical protein